ncbi:unnamed protein product [Rhizophagus irregularis]|nr:unnamed protein product [Rhizophagus irregularis]
MINVSFSFLFLGLGGFLVSKNGKEPRFVSGGFLDMKNGKEPRFVQYLGCASEERRNQDSSASEERKPKDSLPSSEERKIKIRTPDFVFGRNGFEVGNTGSLDLDEPDLKLKERQILDLDEPDFRRRTLKTWILAKMTLLTGM